MVLMTHNTDIADAWEREAEDPRFFYLFSPKGYAVGINIFLYAMTPLTASSARTIARRDCALAGAESDVFAPGAMLKVWKPGPANRLPRPAADRVDTIAPAGPDGHHRLSVSRRDTRRPIGIPSVP